MAQPMFGALGGMTPDQLLQRLGLIGGQPPGTYTVTETPKGEPPSSGGATVTEKPKTAFDGGSPPPDLSDLPLAWQAGGYGDKNLGARLAPSSAPGASLAAPLPAVPAVGATPSFMSAPPDEFPLGVAGTSKTTAPPATPAAAQTMPGFAPINFPPPEPYSPVAVPNAIRTGMYNPGGGDPWDRSQTANSREEELQLRQQAAYNNVLDMIRPGGLGMPGTTGPIVGLQPHEIAALAHLGGQQAENLFKGRNLAETGAGQDREMQLRALLKDQEAKTQLGVADIAGKAHVAGAQAAHTPEAMKTQAMLQLIAQGIAGGVDNDTLAAHVGQFRAAMNANGGAAPLAAGTLGGPVAQVGGSQAVQDQNNEEVNGTRILNQSVGMLGQGKVGSDFKYKEGLGTADTGRLLDYLAAEQAAGRLTPKAMESLARQIQRLPNFSNLRDNIIRSGAGAHYQVAPPVNPRTGKPMDLAYDPRADTGNLPPYVIADDKGELFRFQQNPEQSILRTAGAQFAGEIPYGQVVLPNGAGVINIDNSLMQPGLRTKKLPKETLQGRADITARLLRAMYPSKPQPK